MLLAILWFLSEWTNGSLWSTSSSLNNVSFCWLVLGRLTARVEPDFFSITSETLLSTALGVLVKIRLLVLRLLGVSSVNRKESVFKNASSQILISQSAKIQSYFLTKLKHKNSSKFELPKQTRWTGFDRNTEKQNWKTNKRYFCQVKLDNSFWSNA